MKLNRIIILLLGLFLPVLVLARVGVGVGIGKIVVDQKLKPGLIYVLPSLPVLNTGDEPGDYGVSIEYHEGQETNPQMGLKPKKEWFSFEPSQFHLEPGQVQQVQIKLTLPLKGVKPGNYFAYLEAHPIVKEEAGQTRVGVAAAAKLYFTVAPANFLVGIYYRIASFFVIYSPWSYVVLAIVVLTILIALFRRFFSVKIGISLRKK
jgi:P pilus assembly chaperone PapD